MLSSLIPVKCTCYKPAGSPWFSRSTFELCHLSLTFFFHNVEQFSMMVIIGVQDELIEARADMPLQ